MNRRQRRLLLLCLATVYLVWGTSYVATRIGVTNLPPLLFGGIRFMIGGTLMLALARWRGASFGSLVTGWRHVLVMSVLGVALCNGLQVWAMQWVSSQAGALLNASSALWIVIFGLFGARSHRPTSRSVVGIVVGFIGTCLLVWPSPTSTAATPLVPQLVILAACVVWALGTIYMRNAGGELELFSFGGAQMLVGGILMTLAGLARGEAALWHPSAAGLLAMAYLVVFSSCIAYTAYWWLARNATPALVGTYSYVNPVVTAGAGYAILGERLTPLQLGGAAVILTSVALIYWPTGESNSRN